MVGVLVRSALFLLIVPGTVGLYAPLALIARSTGPPSFRPLPVVGWPLVGAGAALLLWCAGEFALRGRGTPAPIDAPVVLVARGPYRWVRNPMYVGVLTMLGGHLLWSGAGVMIVYAAIVWLAFHVFV